MALGSEMRMARGAVRCSDDIVILQVLVRPLPLCLIALSTLQSSSMPGRDK